MSPISKLTVIALALTLVACAGGPSQADDSDARDGAAPDASLHDAIDAGRPRPDAGHDVGLDAGVDAGTPDAGDPCADRSDAELCADLHFACGSAAVATCAPVRRVDCGPCASAMRCNAAHLCVAQPPEDTDRVCARNRRNCGPLEVTDAQGDSHTVQCGACAAPETCGGGGIEGVCGAPAEPICEADGWCWEAPRVPHIGEAGWANFADDAWALTDTDAFHWNGTGWVRYPSPRRFGVGDVWGRTSRDIWAEEYIVITGGSEQRTANWDGATWSEFPLPAGTWVNGFWGAASNDVWAAGGTGALHFAGAAWAPVDACDGRACTLTAVAGSAADDVWVAGKLTDAARAWAAHWDGSRWEPRDAPSGSVHSIQALAPDDAWAAADDGLFHWDGAYWTKVASADPFAPATVFATAADDVWLAGPAGLRHLESDRWISVSLPVLNPPVRMSGIRGSYGVIAEGSFVTGTPGAWSDRTDFLTSGSLRGVWVAGPDDLWACGERGTLAHFDGSHWTKRASPTVADMNAVWGNSASDVWFVGGKESIYSPPPAPPEIVHWDGLAFSATKLPLDARLYAVWGLGANDVWAAGDDGTRASTAVLLHWNGAAWSSVATGATSGRFTGISGSGANDVWVVGVATSSESLAHHWDGSHWSRAAVPAYAQFVQVLSLSATDAWAVGSVPGGHTGLEAIWHWDGAAWTQSGVFWMTQFVGICATGPTDIFAVGASTEHWDGQAWTTVRLVNPFLASACATVTGSGTWMLGNDGSIVRRRAR